MKHIKEEVISESEVLTWQHSISKVTLSSMLKLDVEH